MKTILLFAGILAAAAASVSSGVFAVGVKDNGNGGCGQSYMQFGYSIPQYGRTYSVSVEVKDIEAAGDKIAKLAASYDVTMQSSPMMSNYAYGRSRRATKTYSFFGKDAAVEKFAQKVIAEGRLLNYNSNANIQNSMYDETKKKADTLSAEMAENKRALDGMPMTSCILNELSDRYAQYLRGYEQAKGKAYISIAVSEMPDERRDE